MQFIKKHRKKIILSVAILAIVAIIIVLLLIFQKDEKVSDETASLTERAKELIENNYLFSYIYQGDIAISDGIIKVDDVTYNYIVDENFKNISSWKDITSLIKNTFVESKWDIYYDKIESGHQYFENDENLYVSKSDTICKNLPPLNIDSVSIEDITDDKMQISWNNQIVYAYKENDGWFLGTDNFYCMDENAK